MDALFSERGDYLVAKLQSALPDLDFLQFRDDLIEQVELRHSRGVVIDVTVLDVIDSFAARTLHAITDMLRLRGVQTMIAGIQPHVAVQMACLQLNLAGVNLVSDFENGLQALDRPAREIISHGR